ncbi:MAG: leucine-rich repeat domain-containing protein [Saprospiraceae bacterium]
MSNKTKLLLFGLFIVQISIIIWAKYDYQTQKSDFEIKLETYLENPRSVKILDFQSFELTDLPDEMLQFQNVEVINLSYNDFEKVPSILYRLPNLKKLNMSHNQLKIIFLQISNSLTHLDFSHNLLTQINGQSYLKALQSIDLSYNQLRAFPSLSGTMDTIDLSNNLLYSFRDIAMKLPEIVQHLDLSNNDLNDFKNAELMMNICYSIDLSNNTVLNNRQLPPALFSENFILKKLFLNNCRFDEIEELWASQLEVFDLGNNNLTITDELVHQLKLKELNLEKQTLENFFLFNLSIQELNIVDATIIGDLKLLLPNLEIIHISDSFSLLSDLPDLPKLQTIYFYTSESDIEVLDNELIDIKLKYPNAKIGYRIINENY